MIEGRGPIYRAHAPAPFMGEAVARYPDLIFKQHNLARTVAFRGFNKKGVFLWLLFLVTGEDQAI